MIDYNPRSWWKLIFMFHRSDTLRILLPTMMGVAVFTTLVAYVENEIFNAQFKNTTVIHSLVGFVLSLLLVFRTNTAYERWWEGRKLWGSFTNNSRNLALKIATLVPDTTIKNRFRVLISNYVMAAKEHLRQGVNTNDLEACDRYPQSYYEGSHHVPNRIMKAIYAEVNDLLERKIITQEQVLFLNAELVSFTDNIGSCERILRTPIPYSYSLFLKKVIFLYVLTMPIGFVLEFKYWAAPIVALVFYVFASIELLAEEIEEPFGPDANDLPVNAISDNIHDNLVEILG